METFAQQTIEQTANQFQGTVKALVLVGIVILTFTLVVLTGVRARSWVPAFGVLLIGAAMYWAVNSWETVQSQVGSSLEQDAGGGGGGSGRNTGG